MTLPRLILASASPRRAELLRELGRPFEIIPSDAEESVSEHQTAVELCQLNAFRKARAVAKRFPDCLVLGSDTLVALGSNLFGKPRDLAEAARMLGELQGKTHLVVTGVCLIHLRRHRQKIFADQTLVTFRPLTAEAIRAYHARVQPLDKAGGYAIQVHGDEIVEAISGSFSNVVGLPLERLREELAASEAG
jgi:septum formation protein